MALSRERPVFLGHPTKTGLLRSVGRMFATAASFMAVLPLGALPVREIPLTALVHEDDSGVFQLDLSGSYRIIPDSLLENWQIENGQIPPLAWDAAAQAWAPNPHLEQFEARYADKTECPARWGDLCICLKQGLGQEVLSQVRAVRVEGSLKPHAPQVRDGLAFLKSAADLFPNVESIHLAGQRLDYPMQGSDLALWGEFWASGALPHLKQLNLSQTGLWPQEVQAFAGLLERSTFCHLVVLGNPGFLSPGVVEDLLNPLPLAEAEDLKEGGLAEPGGLEELPVPEPQETASSGLADPSASSLRRLEKIIWLPQRSFLTALQGCGGGPFSQPLLQAHVDYYNGWLETAPLPSNQQSARLDDLVRAFFAYTLTAPSKEPLHSRSAPEVITSGLWESKKTKAGDSHAAASPSKGQKPKLRPCAYGQHCNKARTCKNIHLTQSPDPAQARAGEELRDAGPTSVHVQQALSPKKDSSRASKASKKGVSGLIRSASPLPNREGAAAAAPKPPVRILEEALNVLKGDVLKAGQAAGAAELKLLENVLAEYKKYTPNPKSPAAIQAFAGLLEQLLKVVERGYLNGEWARMNPRKAGRWLLWVANMRPAEALPDPVLDPFYAEAFFYLGQIAAEGVSLAREPRGETLAQRQTRLIQEHAQWEERWRSLQHLPEWMREVPGQSLD